MRSLALLLLALPALCACERSVRWQQDVRLQDGRSLAVERHSKRAMLGFLSGDTGEISREIAFLHPDGATPIRWLLPRGTAPHLLDFDGPTTYLVLAADSSRSYNDWQCPNPPWIVYRHLAGVWMRIGIDDLPARFATPNLLPMAQADAEKSADGRVAAAEMQAYLNSLPPALRGIGRAKLNPLGAGCDEHVLRRLGREAETAIGGHRPG
jgi:hypothetical protein